VGDTERLDPHRLAEYAEALSDELPGIHGAPQSRLVLDARGECG
jgi:hypothetical protein